MFKLTHLSLAVLAASLLFGGFTAALADPVPLSSADQDFLNAAVQGGIFEIKTGNYAADNAKYDAVQDLGKKLASDHYALNKKLIRFASHNGYSIPAAPSVMTKAKVEELTTLTRDTHFDASYLKTLKDAHKNDIEAFQNEAASTSNGDLRDLVNDALPMLKSHLKHIESTQEKLDNPQ